MEDESLSTAAIEIARKAALTTIAAVLTAFVLGNPIAGAAVGSTVIGLGEKLANFEIRRRQRAVERWWRTMLEDETRSPESVASLISARMEDPRTADAVMRSIRAAVEATDPAVIPALARLEKRRFDEAKAPDAFYRGMVRLLCDVDEAEIATLRAILVAFVVDGQGDEILVHVDTFRPRPKGRWLLTCDVPGGKSPRDLTLAATPLRVLRLLKRNDLGHDCDEEDATEAVDGAPSHAHHILLERNVATRMLHAIGRTIDP